METGAIILGAGAATRMGRPKQLLPFRGRTLIENAVWVAQEADFQPVVVVVGSKAELVGSAVQRTSALMTFNADWQTGMGSSIVRGANYLLEISPELDALAVLLADQPLITANHLEAMRRALCERDAPPVIAACYAGTLGVPAFFRRSHFRWLLDLPADSGARALLRKDDAQVRSFALPEAAIDIDTPEDFAALE